MSPCIIAIAGPSASGKSLFASTLIDEVGLHGYASSPVLINEDSYYRDQSHLPLVERGEVNYDHPDALEQDLLCEHLQALCEGQSVDVPVYDYSSHARSAAVLRLAPAPVIIVEGILLLANQRLRDLCDIKFYVDTPLDICLLRRMARDVEQRGRTLASVVEQYEATVRPMYFDFIKPSARYADMIITGGGRNAIAIDVVKRLVLTHLEVTGA